MFGYITPLKDDLKVAQYNDFRSYYCGLCQHIKKEYGELPRLVLNYDLATLGILLDSLSPKSTYRTSQPCVTNPVKKKPMIVSNDALSYAAAMNVSLAYYKLLDDKQDDKDLKSAALATALKPYTKKFTPHVRRVNNLIATQLQDLNQLETTKQFKSIDEISHPSALIVAYILKHYPHPLHQDSPALRAKLYDFGYALGQWIYIIDAIDDLEKDLKRGNFNPINVLYNQEGLEYEALLEKVREPISFALLNAGATCKKLFDELPLTRNHAILNNIITLGMMDQYTKVMAKGHCKQCHTRKG